MVSYATTTDSILKIITDKISTGIMVLDNMLNVVHYNTIISQLLDVANIGLSGKFYNGKGSAEQIVSAKLKSFIQKDTVEDFVLTLNSPSLGSSEYLCKLEWIEAPQRVILLTLDRVNGEIKLRENLRGVVELYENLRGDVEQGNTELNRFSAAVMQTDTTIVITDLEGKIIFANPKFEVTTGYSIKEALGQNPRILKSGDQPDEYYKEMWQTITGGKVWKGEFRNKRKEGPYYWESATITPIKNQKAEVVEFLAIKEDITDRKEMEAKLEQAIQEMEAVNWDQKMLNRDLKKEVERREQVESELKLQKDLLQELNENLESQVAIELARNREKDELMILQSRQAAMGEMIGNIAHQWRQPLNAVGLMVYDLLDAFRYEEVTEEYLKKSERDIKSVLKHMSQTIDDFRNFFKPDKEKQYFKLDDVLNTTLGFVEGTLKGSGIHLVLKVEENIRLFGYANEFAQVVLNIVNNARDAVTECKCEKPVIGVSGLMKDNMAVISIVDNGGGVPAHIAHKLFDPYFTTKEQGKGTGVGLYMSKNIIEKSMNGVIEFKNIKSGACFTLKLPAEKE